MKPTASLRKRLFFWYVGSLLLLGIFIILAIHVFNLRNGIYFVIMLFLTLAFLGFTIIYKITKSLTYLSEKMKMISSKNLDERVTGMESGDEIGELAETFNKLLDRLHDAFSREQRFIADVAHELKTPLATIRSTLEVIISRKRNPFEYEQSIKEAIRETHEISSTLKNVLDLAWSETPQEQKSSKPFDLSYLVEELLETAEKMGRSKKLSVTGSIDKNIVIEGFQEKLGRALLNVTDNAVKYTPIQGKIAISLKKHRNHAFITVRDNGVGISENDLPHIFDRFYRGSEVSKVFGSGLGLAIAKAIVTSHRGTIKANSKTGKGTSFIISLPLK